MGKKKSDYFKVYGVLNILWHCPSLGLEWKLISFIPVATAEFSKFADIWHNGTFTTSSFRIWNSSVGISSPSPVSSALQADSLPLSYWESLLNLVTMLKIIIGQKKLASLLSYTGKMEKRELPK